MAAIRTDATLITITADMLLEGVHFDRMHHPIEQIGRKAIACSLSDCAGMACEPRAAVVSIALPRTMRLEGVQGMYEGMATIAQEFDCPIVGGDTTSWNGPLVIDVAMLAEPMSERGPVRRDNAREADTIFVSGVLGGSILGRHLTFSPRIELARRLAASPGLHAMMDLSDGLSTDLARLCAASGCSAELSESTLSRAVSGAAVQLADRDGRSALDHALNDGEDFELLVVGDEDLERSDSSLVAVGRIVNGNLTETDRIRIRLQTGELAAIRPGGFEHGFGS
jgi:thiamine-monophosphate kinase